MSANERVSPRKKVNAMGAKARYRRKEREKKNETEGGDQDRYAHRTNLSQGEHEAACLVELSRY